MKTLNRVCQILAIVLALGSLVLFFTHFATIVTGGNNASLVGAQLAFGSKITVAETEYNMAISSKIQFCFWMTVLSFVLSISAIRSKTVRYFAPAAGLVAAIYMLVIAVSNPFKFLDTRPLPNVSAATYGHSVLILAIVLFVFVVASAAYLLIDDYLEVQASKGNKLTIPKRIIHFFRDYKSEVKKIVWPSFKDVVKNTVIVLIMCLLVGILIWLIDYGLGQLLNLILGA